MSSKHINVFGRGTSLAIALILGLVHGLVYVFIIPPWQHYDEPNHFEYVWLISNRGAIPDQGSYDQSMRRAVAKSMLKNDFYKGMNYLPDLNPPEGPIWIGPISQLNNPPLYYLTASVPLRFTLDRSFDFQVIVIRLVSLPFLLVTILAAWGVADEATALDNPLRLLIPASIALLPGFIDIATAVNNDIAAIALVSLCLWGCVRMLKRGITVWNLLWCGSTAVLSLLTKETAFMALPLVIVAFIFSIFREKKRVFAWILLGAGVLAAAVIAISWGDAAGWYRSTSQPGFTRATNPEAVVGEHVFILDTRARVTPGFIPPLFQPVLTIPPSLGSTATYTLGAWMWADSPVQARTPLLGDGFNVHNGVVEVDLAPSFHAFTATIATDQGVRLWVSLDPKPVNGEATVYYDGLVLIEGNISSDIPPSYTTPDGESGDWDGRPFTNLLRNPSAEKGGLRVASWLDDLGAGFLPDDTRPSALLSYALDRQGAGWHYMLTAERLLRTFWAQFGWGHVSLLGNKPYRLLAVITLLGAAGVLVWFARHLFRKFTFPWETVALLALLFVGTWVGTLSRGAIYLGITRLYLPVARYASPAIVPTMVLLSTGWLELLNIPLRWHGLRKYYPVTLLLIWFTAWLTLDIYSIASILAYYGR